MENQAAVNYDNSHQFGREEIEVFISIRDHIVKDKGKSDLFCKVKLLNDGQAEKQIGMTEQIENQDNPDFQKSIEFEFIFETRQTLKIFLYDGDKKNQEEVGICTVDVGSVMGSRNQTIEAPLKNKTGDQQIGQMIIKGDRLIQSHSFISWSWYGQNLANTDGMFGKSDPFLQFFRQGNGAWFQVYETEVIKDTLNPSWKNFTINVGQLNKEDIDNQFKVECWDHSQSGQHNYIGEFETTWNLIQYEQKDQFILEDQILKKRQNPGEIYVSNLVETEVYSFLDYIQDGEEINLIMGIDFTASNGDQREDTSLHYLDHSGNLNHYQSTLKAIGGILLNYDKENSIQLYGFGGIPQYPNFKQTEIDNCFPLTGNTEKVRVYKVEGILKTYEEALPLIQFLGPSHMVPLFQKAKTVAEKYKAELSKKYVVLVILTDGDLHDASQLSNQLLNSRDLPISVIIIGIGKGDFSSMKILDDIGGRFDARDLVQFVQFEQFKNNPVLLTQEVLEQLPSQLVSYKQKMNLKPNVQKN